MGNHTMGSFYAGLSLFLPFVFYPPPFLFGVSVPFEFLSFLQLGKYLTFVKQLAEAILTEPDPTLANIPGSIRLADTRTITNEVDAIGGDTERDVFLPGDLSDSDSDDGSEGGTGAEGKTRISGLEANGNGVLGNLGARLSRVEISPAATHADWEDDEIHEHGTEVGKPGGLSSKAGSILVCLVYSSQCTLSSYLRRDYTTYLS